MTVTEKLHLLAPDLSKTFPRSPRETLGGFVIAARALDKCRAVLAGTNGEYHFDCPLDRTFLEFAGLSADDFKAAAASGATDAEIAAWVLEIPRSRTPKKSSCGTTGCGA